jgi:cyclic pyranopterin phosphate synthase
MQFSWQTTSFGKAIASQLSTKSGSLCNFDQLQPHLFANNVQLSSALLHVTKRFASSDNSEGNGSSANEQYFARYEHLVRTSGHPINTFSDIFSSAVANVTSQDDMSKSSSDEYFTHYKNLVKFSGNVLSTHSDDMLSSSIVNANKSLVNNEYFAHYECLARHSNCDGSAFSDTSVASANSVALSFQEHVEIPSRKETSLIFSHVTDGITSHYECLGHSGNTSTSAFSSATTSDTVESSALPDVDNSTANEINLKSECLPRWAGCDSLTGISDISVASATAKNAGDNLTLSENVKISKGSEINPTFSHVDDAGKVKMVDVGAKSYTQRVAVATGRVLLGATAFHLVVENRMKKGDVLVTAKIAGIMAAKRTSELIPLCHNIQLSSVDVELNLEFQSCAVAISCTAKCRGQTGVEMEALTGVTVAALTVYDMCKSVSHDIVIGDVHLVSKTGGKNDVC